MFRLAGKLHIVKFSSSIWTGPISKDMVDLLFTHEMSQYVFIQDMNSYKYENIRILGKTGDNEYHEDYVVKTVLLCYSYSLNTLAPAVHYITFFIHVNQLLDNSIETHENRSVGGFSKALNRLWYVNRISLYI